MKPWVRKQVMYSVAVLACLQQASLNEVCQLGAEVTVLRHVRAVLLPNLVVHLEEVARLLERELARDDLNEHDTEAPHIACVVILLTLHALRTHVRHCAHEGFSFFTLVAVVVLLRDTKVSDLYESLSVQQDVVRLDVSVHLLEHHIQVGQAAQYLLKDFGADRLGYQGFTLRDVVAVLLGRQLDK